MKAIIVGAGFTGVQLAQKLVAEKWDVILIDKSSVRVREAESALDCAVVSSEGNSLDVLESSGVASADALVAVTEDDETNMMTCALVEAVYPQILTIARVRNDAYYTQALLDQEKENPRRRIFGVGHMVRPNVEISAAIVRAVMSGAVGDLIELDEGWIVLCITVGAGSPLAGMSLKLLPSVEGWKFLVAYVMSGETTSLPDGSTKLHVGDRVGVLLQRSDVAGLLALARVKPGSSRRMAVYGAGRIGGRVADGVRRTGRKSPLAALFETPDGDRRNLILVDPDPDRCLARADEFRDVRVICGDMTDRSVVDEEQLDSCGLVVAASDNFDRNLVVAAYMKSLGVPKTIALTENAEVAEIARKLGIDVAVPMRETVVDNILSYLRGPNVSSVHTICGGDCELVTCKVKARSRAAGKAVKDIALAGEFLLLLVSPAAAGPAVMPRGDTVLMPGDEVVLVARDGRKVARIFAD